MGNADADLMFVGEAPGFHEDQQGKPFVGRAGKLLDELLGEIGLTRDQCFIANVLKCRPPDNRDPQPDEIDACKPHLMRKIELIQPRVICTLGNFATKLLSGRPDGITKVRGTPQVRELGGNDRVPVPDLPPGRRAPHAGDAGTAARGLPEAAGAARHGEAGASAGAGADAAADPRAQPASDSGTHTAADPRAVSAGPELVREQGPRRSDRRRAARPVLRRFTRYARRCGKSSS